MCYGWLTDLSHDLVQVHSQERRNLFRKWVPFALLASPLSLPQLSCAELLRVQCFWSCPCSTSRRHGPRSRRGRCSLLKDVLLSLPGASRPLSYKPLADLSHHVPSLTHLVPQEYLDMSRVKKVDLYENGTIAIVEAVSPELGNRVQRVRVQLPGTSQVR